MIVSISLDIIRIKRLTQLLVDTLLDVLDILVNLLELGGVRTLSLMYYKNKIECVMLLKQAYVCLENLNVTVIQS